MKISKLFHWLYLFVMALPLMVAPIFAIYSHRHTIDSYSASNNESNNINAYQYVVNGKPINTDHYTFGGDIFSVNNNGFLVLGDNNDTSFTLVGDMSPMLVNENDIIYYQYTDYHNVTNDLYFGIGSNVSGAEVEIDALFESTTLNTYYGNFDWVSESNNLDYFYISGDFNGELLIKDIMFFNLSTIFGSGNEPLADTFKGYLTEDYYNNGNNVISIGYHNVTYNDTDIGSQFVYDMYNCIDKYFNYDKVVNFGDLYGWLNTTFFSGQAPLGFFIFWHLLIYWLLTSLLWLIFDVLMYVPLLVHRWLDKASLS